jgi:hypothetical protein
MAPLPVFLLVKSTPLEYIPRMGDFLYYSGRTYANKAPHAPAADQAATGEQAVPADGRMWSMRVDKHGVRVEAIEAADKAMGPSDYRVEDCHNCGRMRVELNGICDKCQFNNGPVAPEWIAELAKHTAVSLLGFVNIKVGLPAEEALAKLQVAIITAILEVGAL